MVSRLHIEQFNLVTGLLDVVANSIGQDLSPNGRIMNKRRPSEDKCVHPDLIVGRCTAVKFSERQASTLRVPCYSVDPRPSR